MLSKCVEPPDKSLRFWWVEIKLASHPNSGIYIEPAAWTGGLACPRHQDDEDDADDGHTGCWEIMAVVNSWRVVKVFGPVSEPPPEAIARQVEIELQKEK